MKTIALRFSDNFAPKDGTMAEHQKIISTNGYVWYGKLGNKISPKVMHEILKNGPVQIVFIKSGSSDRFLADLIDVSYERQTVHPAYYGNDATFMKTWLKLSNIQKVDNDILDNCSIASTGKKINDILKKTMGSYFIINFD